MGIVTVALLRLYESDEAKEMVTYGDHIRIWFPHMDSR